METITETTPTGATEVQLTESAKPKKATKKLPKPAAAPKSHKATKEAKPTKKTSKKSVYAPRKPAAKASENGNKKAEVIALMKRANGVSLGDIMAATGWQKHTVRGFVSILGKKGGVKVDSFKNDNGVRYYKIAK